MINKDVLKSIGENIREKCNNTRFNFNRNYDNSIIEYQKSLDNYLSNIKVSTIEINIIQGEENNGL